MTDKKVLQQAIDKWGIPAQIEMAIEECSELILALQKFKRNYKKGEDNSQLEFNVCDEIADVSIITKELELIFPKDLIDKRKEFKIKRLIKRLNK